MICVTLLETAQTLLDVALHTLMTDEVLRKHCIDETIGVSYTILNRYES